jgi:hypothetical protein
MSSSGAPPPSRAAPAATPETAALLDRLVRLADSTSDRDQGELAKLLTQRGILDQLDEPSVRDKSRTADLRIAVVLRHLQDNTSAPAQQTLAHLARNQLYGESWQRKELLIRALETQRPLRPEALAFMDAQARPDSVNLHIAIDALSNNATKEALDLLGRKLADPQFEFVYRLGWIRTAILRNRRAPEILRAAQGWLAPGALDRELQIGLAEALFDYRPDEWYPGRDGWPRPPDERTTSPEAAALARRVGQSILASDYPAAVKTAVRQTLKRLPAP